jgi:murein DD-endopeptidase MepM/ murein hydrolase activator NlpD
MPASARDWIATGRTRRERRSRTAAASVARHQRSCDSARILRLGGFAMRIRPSFRTLVIAAALVEGALLAGVATYLAATGKALVVRFASREEMRRAETPPRLVIPVAGVRAAELRDSFGAGRSGGRRHLGIDIMAPRGTPVLAAAPGVIVKRDTSALGGISIYQRGSDERTIYFYAHLQGYRPGLAEGELVRAGDVIGYVGTTGNAQGGSPHLHFGVYTVADPNRWWHGRDLNPFPLLRDGAAR